MAFRTCQGRDRLNKKGRGDSYGGVSPIVEGVLDGKGDRFGFIRQEGDDIFISGRNLNSARHGDTVKAVIIGNRPGRDGSQRIEGKVVAVLERNPLNVVATVIFDGAYFAQPDERRYGERLPLDALGGASEHDKVVIKIKASDYGDRAEVLYVLGRFDEIGMDVKSVIASHNLRTEFPQDVTDQAESYGDKIDRKEANAPYRRDFRGVTVFTIDGSDSKDFDDAVSIEKTESGYKLGVYIADVSHYVTEKSPLDREAYARGTSIYLADRVIPMLPETLSNGLCSLNEGEDRLTLCALINLDERGYVMGYEVCEGVIRSCARLTYVGVQAILDGDQEQRERFKHVVKSLEIMQELAKKRIAIRKARGSVDFKLTETQIKFDAVGHVVDIAKKPSLMSMKIIEEFMILANCAVAEKFCKSKIPFVYRVHDRPSPEKLSALNDFLEAAGIREALPLDPEPKQVAALLNRVDAEHKEQSGAVSRVALRSMAKAEYEPTNAGHFGLAERFYCHFTSPIRRYPDLVIHRIIKAYLKGGAAATKKYRDFTIAAARESSARERVALDCERKVDDYKKAEYMSHRIGEKYTGVISSVTDFGFFVELDNSAEGLVRISSLPPNASYDVRRLMISCGKKKFRLGDTVDIIVEKVEGDRVDFLLA
ncbi:MAG: ribonuclease R [Clostridiales bacterium]|nr:ribonuclease R [Clostridiales bacterium]